MPIFHLALVVALLVPCAGVAETVVNMPAAGFRYTTQTDVESTSTSGVNTKGHSVLRREVTASDGTVF